MIEAIQFIQGMDSEPLHQFFGDTTQEISFSTGDGEDVLSLAIDSPNGELVVLPGEWIIKGVEGEIYPCPASVFEKVYEAV